VTVFISAQAVAVAPATKPITNHLILFFMSHLHSKQISELLRWPPDTWSAWPHALLLSVGVFFISRYTVESYKQHHKGIDWNTATEQTQ
jgi:hypothetical protein